MSTFYNFISGLDWRQILFGGAIGALTLGFRTVIQAPVKALTQHALAIRYLGWLSPQEPFSGRWEVTWHVTSSRFPDTNIDTVRIHCLFGSVTFTTSTTLRDGTPETCVFVGKLVDRTLTGRWYDPKDQDRGYFGVFQVRLHGGLREGQGAWSGWTSEGTVQSDFMTLRKVA